MRERLPSWRRSPTFRAGLILLLVGAGLIWIGAQLHPGFILSHDGAKRVININRASVWQMLFGGAAPAPLAVRCGDTFQLVLDTPPQGWTWEVTYNQLPESREIVRPEIPPAPDGPAFPAQQLDAVRPVREPDRFSWDGGIVTFHARSAGQTILRVRPILAAMGRVDAEGMWTNCATQIAVQGPDGCASAGTLVPLTAPTSK